MGVIEHERTAEVVATQGSPVISHGLPTIFVREDLTYSSSFDIVEADDEWTVVDTETGIFGVGTDEDLALRDYLAALVEHRDVLLRQQSLSEDLAAQLRYLRRIIG